MNETNTTIKLQDSEIRVMDVLWREGDLPAKTIADILTEQVGWNVNTTYTLIKRCIGKGAIERTEPKFMCHALIPRTQVQVSETRELLDKIFDGAADKLVAALLDQKALSRGEIEGLKALVARLDEEA